MVEGRQVSDLFYRYYLIISPLLVFSYLSFCFHYNANVSLSQSSMVIVETQFQQFNHVPVLKTLQWKIFYRIFDGTD